MIDTIVFRIHNIDKYATLIKNLDLQEVSGYTSEIAVVNKDELEYLRKRNIKNPKEYLQILRQNEKNEFLIKTKVKKHQSTSSHFTISYIVNYSRSFLEFNFSIPKYIFGHNVMMFVDHFGDKDFNYHLGATIEHNINRSYYKLMNFLFNFFKNEFIGCPVDQRDVEINRIDVCFNQIFPNKKEALKYLNYQKRIKKKHSREDMEIEDTFERVITKTTSIMYVSQRYSAKIYHKGAEYQKHDAKRHIQFNRKKNKQYFNINDIQDLADRILRYELTIRNKQLNYLHKKYIFRSNCPIYRKYYTIYNDVLRKEQKNDRIGKAIGILPEEKRVLYAKEHPYEPITKEEWQIKRVVSRLITSKTHFMMDVDESVKIYNRQTIDTKCNIASFSRKLLFACTDLLCDFIDQFQIRELPMEEALRKRITEYNSRKRKKLPEGEMIRFYQQFTKIGSFKDTANLLEMSRATLFRYKERFKKLGIGENNLIPLTPDGLPEAPIDFRTYHQIMTYSTSFRTRNSLYDLRQHGPSLNC